MSNRPSACSTRRPWFLHRVETDLPEAKKRILRQIHETDPVLANRKVLIVDDDLRNIFALTSMLELHRMQVLYAENGRDGIELLQRTPDVDIILMDIMMPEMDGYETMRAIRGMEHFKSLPIIALTAKAMKGDRRKCIEAGASDYIAKPCEFGAAPLACCAYGCTGKSSRPDGADLATERRHEPDS